MKYDAIIIGGGPAGMMAAGRAGELGVRALLLEKNKTLGVKLLATGGGRCNITNKIDGLKALAARYGKNGKFLFSALNNFGPEDVVAFFEEKRVKTKIENAGRVFPASDKARDVLNALVDHIKKQRVEIRTSAEVREIIKKNGKIEKVMLADGEEIFADNFVIAAGGRSYPATGSSGDGYRWLEKLGHRATNLTPALVPIILKESFVKDLEGVSLKNAEASVYKDSKKIASRRGEMMFTSNGMSGPAILDISGSVAKALPGKVKLRIDLVPEADLAELNKNIQADLQEGNKMLKNCFSGYLPQKMVLLMSKLARIDPEKKANFVTREERNKLLRFLKNFEVEAERAAGFEKAMATSGGIDLKEIDPKTMRSKIIDNLYFAGEILGIDGPTGGYNLQVSWSTGRAAGESLAKP